jgi:hypothetical protein
MTPEQQTERNERLVKLQEEISFLVEENLMEEESRDWIVVCLLEIRREILQGNPDAIKHVDDLLNAIAEDGNLEDEEEDEDEDEDEEE